MVGNQVRKEVLIVLPKYSAYQIKPNDIKDAYESLLKSMLEMYRDCGYDVVCFSEDMLAAKLLSNDEQVHWETVIGFADNRFLLDFADDYPREEYCEVFNNKAEHNYSDYVRDSYKKYKPAQIAEFNGDEVAYAGDRLNAIGNRIRFVVNKALEFHPNIVYFDANNNYCNLPKMVPGNGKAVTIVYPNSGIVNHYYGGILLKREMFERVLRSRCNGQNV